MNIKWIKSICITALTLCLGLSKIFGQDLLDIKQSKKEKQNSARIHIQWKEPLQVKTDKIKINFTEILQVEFEKNILYSNKGIQISESKSTGIFVSQKIKVPIESPEPFLAMSCMWKTEGADDGLVKLSIRSSPSDINWTEWLDISVDEHATPQPGEFFGNLIFLDKETRYVQYRFTLEMGLRRVSPIVKTLQITFISPGATPKEILDEMKKLEPQKQRQFDEELKFPSLNKLYQIDSIDHDLTMLQFPRPPFISRTGWGCPEGQLSPRWPPVRNAVTHLIIHHTVNSNTSTDWPAVVRTIWVQHANTNNWGDIGYNWLIDPNGILYQGRAWWQDTDDNVVAGHTLGYNVGSIGVALLGQFHPPHPNPPSGNPSDAALTTTRRVLAWKFSQLGFDPRSQATLVDKFTYRISGHRDYTATACPGDNLYTHLPSTRNRVYALLNPPTAITNAASNITQNSATLNGVINPKGSLSGFFFQWGTSTAYGNFTPNQIVGDGTSNVPVSINLTGLQPNTTYHFRLVAANSDTFTLGANQTFTTLATSIIISVSPTSVNFGNVAVGQSLERTVTISNSSTSSGVLSGSISISGTDFSIVSGGGSYSLSPGQSQAVIVRFAPSGLVSRSGTLTISHNATNQASPTNVSLSGTGTAFINISVSPTSISFGNVAVGQSRDTPVTITNQSSSTGTLTGNVTISGTDFSIFSGADSYSLYPGQSRTVTVRFSPSSATSRSGSLSIEHNATNQTTPFNVSLSGNGTGTSMVNISVSPMSINFGNVAIGQSRETSVTITNQTNSTGILTGNVSISGTDFSIVSGGVSYSLSPGQSRTVNVQFVPSAATTRTGTLSITHNATNFTSPINISINGVGVTDMLISDTLASGLSISSKIVMDADAIYWAEDDNSVPYYQDATTGLVRKVSKGGGPITTTLASGLNHPTAVLVDDSFVYFIERGSWPRNNGTLKRVPKGGGPVSTLATGLNYPQGPCAIDATHIYFGDPCSIKKVGKNGGAVTTIVTDVCWGPNPIAVDNSGNLFYILTSALTSTWTLKRVNINGGDVSILATVSTQFNDIALDSFYVYWTEQGVLPHGNPPVAGRGAVKKVAKIGGEVTTLATGLNASFGSALDSKNGYLYWVENGTWTNDIYNAHTGSIKRVHIAGGPIVTLKDSLNYPSTIQVDSSYLYWAETPSVGHCVIKKARLGPPTSISINDEKFNGLYTLFQNYPNPFNPSTTIKFTLPERAKVNLSVYNLFGEKVVELVNDELNAGYHETQWNASGFSSGIYFYRLIAGSFTDTKKLILLK